MGLGMRLVRLMLLGWASWGAPLAEANPLEPFAHQYEASYEGLPFNARGTRSLTQRSDGRFQFESSLGALFMGVEEQSTFALDASGDPRALYYVTRQQGLGRQRERRLIFDWDQRTLTRTGDKPRKDPLSPGTFDPLNWQLALGLRLQATPPKLGAEIRLTMTDGGDPTVLRWRVAGQGPAPQGEAGSPGGEAALRLEREFEAGEDETMTLWFAEGDGTLLRMEHREGGRLLTIWLTARGTPEA
jgi:hypothetical protein